MTVIFDPDVQEAAEFLQSRFLCSKLVSIAEGLAVVAPGLWGHYGAEQVVPIRLSHPSILACDRHTQSNATESCLVHGRAGDESVAVEARPD
jgi:hypothetical protein